MNIFNVTLSTVDLFLLSACGALVVIFIRLRYASEVRSRDIFNIAAKEFTATFHKELKEIYQTPMNWPDDINHYLSLRIDNLKEAKGKFRDHLPRRKRKSFDDAWFSFYCYTGREVDKNCQTYHHYTPYISTSIVNGKEIIIDTTKTYKDTFKKNIDALLKYAKQK